MTYEIEKGPPKFSFCKTTTAGPGWKWHIRELTKKGKRLSGGADTPSLCGALNPLYGWDLNVNINEYHLENSTCLKCRELYLKERTKK